MGQSPLPHSPMNGAAMKSLKLGAMFDRILIRHPRLRELATKLFYRPGLVEVDLFQKRITIDRVKENGYYRASRAGSRLGLYRDEAIILQRLALFCQDDTTFVDVGANVGIFSCCLADIIKIRRNFKVCAFEVHPETFLRLQINAQRHGFEAINAAVSDEGGTLTFVEGAVSHVTTRQKYSSSCNIQGRTFNAEAVRLDSFIFSGEVLLKIDVEGQELEVLSSASKLFENGLVRAVYIDGFSDPRVLTFLKSFDLVLLDCTTLSPATDNVYSLLAVKPKPS